MYTITLALSYNSQMQSIPSSYEAYMYWIMISFIYLYTDFVPQQESKTETADSEILVMTLGDETEEDEYEIIEPL